MLKTIGGEIGGIGAQIAAVPRRFRCCCANSAKCYPMQTLLRKHKEDFVKSLMERSAQEKD